MKKETIIQIVIIVLLVVILGFLVNLTINQMSPNNMRPNRGQMGDFGKNTMQEETVK